MMIDFLSIHLEVLVTSSTRLSPTEHHLTWKQTMSIKYWYVSPYHFYNSFRVIELNVNIILTSPFQNISRFVV